MLSKGGTGDDKETVFCQAGDGEVALDSTALIQALGVDDRTHRLIDIIGADMVEESQRTWAAHLKLIEGSFVKQASVLAGHQMFITDGTRPVVVRPAFGFMTMACFLFVRFEPVGAFPAGLLSKMSSPSACRRL